MLQDFVTRLICPINSFDCECSNLRICHEYSKKYILIYFYRTNLIITTIHFTVVRDLDAKLDELIVIFIIVSLFEAISRTF